MKQRHFSKRFGRVVTIYIHFQTGTPAHPAYRDDFRLSSLSRFRKATRISVST